MHRRRSHRFEFDHVWWRVTGAGEPLLVAENISRRFGHRQVVRGVSFEIAGGEAMLLVGHNGAGKTTLLRLLAGLLRPSAGKVIRSGALGMVAHHTMLYDALTARENMAFFGRLHGNVDPQRIDALLERIGLSAHGDRRIAAYSRGMLQRLAIARTLLSDPQVLLLDEPMTGLDDAASTVVRDVLRDLRVAGRALVIATHQLVELVDVVTSVGFLVAGRLVAIEPMAGRDAPAVMARYREHASSA